MSKNTNLIKILIIEDITNVVCVDGKSFFEFTSAPDLHSFVEFARSHGATISFAEAKASEIVSREMLEEYGLEESGLLDDFDPDDLDKSFLQDPLHADSARYCLRECWKDMSAEELFGHGQHLFKSRSGNGKVSDVKDDDLFITQSQVDRLVNEKIHSLKPRELLRLLTAHEETIFATLVDAEAVRAMLSEDGYAYSDGNISRIKEEVELVFGTANEMIASQLRVIASNLEYFGLEKEQKASQPSLFNFWSMS